MSAGLLAGHAEVQDERGQPDLSAVVQVALDPAQRGGCPVDRQRTGPLQLTDPPVKDSRPSSVRASHASAATAGRASSTTPISSAAPGQAREERPWPRSMASRRTGRA